MAKCRECNGVGSDFDPSDYSNKRCLTCGGSGEVSDAPEHFATGALPPLEVEWVSGRTAGEILAIQTLLMCRRHFQKENNLFLLAKIDDTLQRLGIPTPNCILED